MNRFLVVILASSFLFSCGNQQPPTFDLSKVEGLKIDTTTTLSYPQDTVLPVAAIPMEVKQVEKVQAQAPNDIDTSNGVSINNSESFRYVGNFPFSKIGDKVSTENTVIKVSTNTFRIEKNGKITDYKILSNENDKNFTIQDSRLVSYYVTFKESKGQIVEVIFPTKSVFVSKPVVKNSFKPQGKFKPLNQFEDCKCTTYGNEIAWEGLTPYAIAKHYRISVEQVLKANPQGIRVGKKFCLKTNCQ